LYDDAVAPVAGKRARLFGEAGGTSEGSKTDDGGHVRSLGAVVGRVSAVAFTAVLLASCQSDDGGDSVEFVGPNAGDLIVGYERGCDADDSATQSDVLALGAQGFTPQATITLSWKVDTRGLNGSWDGVKAGHDGSLSASVRLPRELIDPGDQVEIWAEGSSSEGISALSKVVPIGDC